MNIGYVKCKNDDCDQWFELDEKDRKPKLCQYCLAKEQVERQNDELDRSKRRQSGS